MTPSLAAEQSRGVPVSTGCASIPASRSRVTVPLRTWCTRNPSGCTRTTVKPSLSTSSRPRSGGAADENSSLKPGRVKEVELIPYPCARPVRPVRNQKCEWPVNTPHTSWDSITSSTHFVSPAVVGFTLAGGTVEPGVVLVLGSFFLWGMAAHAFGAVQDIVPDRQAGIGSIATALGARGTVRLSLALWALAGLLVLAAPWPAPLAAVVPVPYLINCASSLRVTDTTAASTNRAWRRFIYLNYFAGFLVTLIMIDFWIRMS